MGVTFETPREGHKTGMRQRHNPDVEDEPDFAEEHTPSGTDPPNAQPDDGNPDERWDMPTEV